MSQAGAPPAASQRIKQKRGQKTYDALIATGFKLLAQQEFEATTIAELARAAGYSVGAFYARFKSKDAFLDALIAQHIAHRTRAREHLFATLPPEEMNVRFAVQLALGIINNTIINRPRTDFYGTGRVRRERSSRFPAGIGIRRARQLEKKAPQRQLSRLRARMCIRAPELQ